MVKALFTPIGGGDHGNLRYLAARAGSGTHRNDLKGGICPIKGIELLLGKAGIGRQYRNALGRIQRRAAANAQNKIRVCCNRSFR